MYHLTKMTKWPFKLTSQKSASLLWIQKRGEEMLQKTSLYKQRLSLGLEVAGSCELHYHSPPCRITVQAHNKAPSLYTGIAKRGNEASTPECICTFVYIYIHQTMQQHTMLNQLTALIVKTETTAEVLPVLVCHPFSVSIYIHPNGHPFLQWLNFFPDELICARLHRSFSFPTFRYTTDLKKQVFFKQHVPEMVELGYKVPCKCTVPQPPACKGSSSEVANKTLT